MEEQIEAVRRMRLSKSALRLRDKPFKIIDIALELGFSSVDGYQRAFFREFGCKQFDSIYGKVQTGTQEQIDQCLVYVLPNGVA